MVICSKDVRSSLTSACDGVKRKAGCVVPEAGCGAHGAWHIWRKAPYVRQRASSSLRDAASRCRVTLDIGHSSGCTKQNASRAGRDASCAMRDTGNTCHLTLGRRRAAGRAKRGPKDAMRSAENAGRVAWSAMRAAFAKGRQIGPRGRFSTLSTSPWCLLRLCWEKAGLYEVGKK